MKEHNFLIFLTFYNILNDFILLKLFVYNNDNNNVSISSLARNILDSMLALDPEERLSAEQCLQHPYFESYHDPEDEVFNIKCNIDV